MEWLRITEGESAALRAWWDPTWHYATTAAGRELFVMINAEGGTRLLVDDDDNATLRITYKAAVRGQRSVSLSHDHRRALAKLAERIAESGLLPIIDMLAEFG